MKVPKGTLFEWTDDIARANLVWPAKFAVGLLRCTGILPNFLVMIKTAAKPGINTRPGVWATRLKTLRGSSKSPSPQAVSTGKDEHREQTDAFLHRHK